MNHHQIEVGGVAFQLHKLLTVLHNILNLLGVWVLAKLTCIFCCFGQLLFKVVAVNHHEDAVVVQFTDMAHLADKKHHSERLATTLRVPDDSASTLPIGAAFEFAQHLAHCSVLLVATDDFDEAIIFVHKQGEVAKNVNQNLMVEHAFDEDFLTFRRVDIDAFGVFFRKNVLPVEIEIKIGGDGATTSLYATGDDAEQVGME